MTLWRTSVAAPTTITPNSTRFTTTDPTNATSSSRIKTHRFPRRGGGGANGGIGIGIGGIPTIGIPGKGIPGAGGIEKAPCGSTGPCPGGNGCVIFQQILPS
jgi:hypothetical protein